MVVNQIRWTVQDLEGMPDDWGWKRYEIIDGELIVTRAPHIEHQSAGGNILVELTLWSRQSQLGRAYDAPGVVLSESDAVIPDVVWASNQRIADGVDEAGHFVVAPELVIEILSAGLSHEQRDRKSKLKLYSLYGVQEYWIVNWRLKTIEVYRRRDVQLQLVATLVEGDRLASPLLPGFECAIANVFQ